MNVTILLVAMICIAALFCVAFQNKAKGALAEKKRAEVAKSSSDEKLESSRKDLARAREDLAKKSKELMDLREMAKKKQKREAIKSQEDTVSDFGINTDQDEQSKRTLEAMQIQLNAAKDDAQQAEKIAYQRLQDEFLKREAGIKNELKKMEAELGQTQRDLQKKTRTPQLGDLTPQLETLPPDVVSELARLFRKAEQHEQLHAAAQGKLKMSKEKYNELQRRYFAVCRELALAVSQNAPLSDEDAKKMAETIILAEPESLPH